MNKEQIEKAAAEYADKNWPNGRFNCTSETSFTMGANWRINSVWHDVGEQPKRNEIYLVQMGKDGFDTFYDSENWESFSKDLNIVRWAYIEDLLPNTEE